MYRVCSLRLGLKFEMQPETEKNSYLWSEAEKILAFVVFTMKYLRPYG